EIRPTKISAEYLVLSQKKGTRLFYTVNTELFSKFFPSLSPNDHAWFSYIVY
ncbi:5663_t:CDS:2, partial [Dentiscutata erythropus]